MEKAGLYLGDVRKVNKTYIRTKDKIYEVLEERDMYYEVSFDIETGEKISKDYSKCVNPPKQYITKNGAFYEEDIIGKSNSIDQLCDGYYVQIDNWKFDMTHLFDKLEDAIKSFEDWKNYSNRKYLDYKISINAFIKTEHGLIYVAELNEDKELILI